MHTYNSSKGPVPIDTMVYSHAKAALAKLYRDEPLRTAEIGALELHVKKLEDNPPEAVAASGHNSPPSDESAPLPKGWDAIKIHMDDLLIEATNWADGAAVKSQNQADEIGRLRQKLQDAANLADGSRVEEKRPLDEQAQQIQDRYNAYIAPMKNKVPGSVSKAVTALGNLLTPWLNKLEDEKRAREAKAREEAEAAQAAAIDARKEMLASGDLSSADEAASLLDAAEDAQRSLRAIEREKVQAKGEYRAIGLRSRWTATLRPGEGGIALKHYAQTQPERVKGFLQILADEDTKNSVRSIPGFDVQEQRIV